MCPGHYTQEQAQKRKGRAGILKNVTEGPQAQSSLVVPLRFPIRERKKKAATIRGFGPERGESDARSISHHACLCRSAYWCGSVPCCAVSVLPWSGDNCARPYPLSPGSRCAVRGFPRAQLVPASCCR